MSKKIREVQVLEGVKFLCLNNRSYNACTFGPRKLEQVDAVLRDLEVTRLLHEPPLVNTVEPITLEGGTDIVEIPEQVIFLEPLDDVAKDLINSDVLIEESWQKKESNSVKAPFLACLQYDHLESSSDIIYDLIRSVKINNEMKISKSSPLLLSCTFDTELSKMSDLDVKQAQRLVDLSEWRNQLMKKVASYDITGLVDDFNSPSAMSG